MSTPRCPPHLALLSLALACRCLLLVLRYWSSALNRSFSLYVGRRIDCPSESSTPTISGRSPANAAGGGEEAVEAPA